MATLSKHGTEIGRIETLDKQLSYRSDGTIMVNQGFGWKMLSSKKHDDIRAVYQGDLRAQAEQLPALLDYIKVVQQYPLKLRHLISTAVRTSYRDPDGLWSDLNEMTDAKITLDDALELCEAYQQYLLQKENSPFAVISLDGEHETLVEIVQGSAAFRQEQYKRLRSVYGKIRTRTAQAFEIQAYLAFGNEVTREHAQ